MKDPVIYIVESLVCGGVFMLIYRSLVMRCGSFGFARGYLIAATLLSLVIPLFSIPLWPGRTIYVSSLVPEAAPVADVYAGGEAVAAEHIFFSAAYVFPAVYILVAVFMLAVVVWDIARIWRIRRGAESVEGYSCNVYSSASVESPFSYMRSIYINNSLKGSRRDQVVAHETSHIRHGHQAEKSVMSLLRLVQWYNPFVWAARRYMIELHEYQADCDVLAEGYDITEYRQLILEQVMGYNPDITCGLNGSLTKKRFIMMTKNRNMKNGWLRVGSTALAASGLMMLFSFTRMPDEYIVSQPEEPDIVQGGGDVSEHSPTLVDKLVYEDQTPAVYDANEEVVVTGYGTRPVDEVISRPDGPPQNTEEDDAFVITETMPMFEGGGFEKFRAWLVERVEYPEELIDTNIVGDVIVLFVIEHDGQIGHIKVLQSPSQLLSDAVVKQIKLSPKWTPGKNKDVNVRVQYTLTVKFA